MRLKPERATFTFYNENDDSYDEITETSYSVYVTNLDDPRDDGIRDIKDSNWDNLMGNAAENMFVSDLTLTECRKYLLSIGMTEWNHKQVMSRW